MRELYSEKLLFLPFTYQVNHCQVTLSETPSPKPQALRTSAKSLRGYFHPSLNPHPELLPPCGHQVNDYKTSFSHARRPKANRRAEHRLPKDTTLLANFNQLYKIDPPTLDLWIRVFNATLARMPPGAREEGGVKLWLLKFPPAAAARLLAEADKRGLPQRKIVLSDRIDKEAHVERVQLADLFLDNHHVNAHTTASEVLPRPNPLSPSPAPEVSPPLRTRARPSLSPPIPSRSCPRRLNRLGGQFTRPPPPSEAMSIQPPLDPA